MSKDKRTLIPDIEMPDVDITGWVKEVNVGACTKYVFHIPESVNQEIDVYNDFRTLAGLTRLNKPDVLLHFIKLGLGTIEYPNDDNTKGRDKK